MGVLLQDSGLQRQSRESMNANYAGQEAKPLTMRRMGATPNTVEVPAKTRSSTSMPKKLVDMLTPLLSAGSKGKRAMSPAPAALSPSPATTPMVSPSEHTRDNPQAATPMASPTEAYKDAHPVPAAPTAAQVKRIISQDAALMTHIDKMQLAAASYANSYGYKKSNDSTTSTSSSSSVVATPPRPASPMSSSVFPSLEHLLDAARHCSLPPSPRADERGYCQTIMLSLSPTLPPNMVRSRWCLKDYMITAKLYTGYASQVFKAICRRSGEMVILKVYSLSSVCDLYKYQIYREVRVHSSLMHENIVHLYASFQEGDNVVMVEEYADGSDLFTLLHKYGGKVPERLAVEVVLDPFMRVLQYLHSRGIVHRDIKPENIMFNRNMVLKLGDFGLAIDLREERAVTRAGTLDYMAPEVLRCPFKSHPEENKDNIQLHYNSRVDSWAVGVLSYELLVGFPPFFDKERKTTEQRIVSTTPAFPATMSEAAKDFVSSALHKNALDRPTILDMLHHPWVELYRHRRSLRHPGTAGAAAAAHGVSSSVSGAAALRPESAAPGQKAAPAAHHAAAATGKLNVLTAISSDLLSHTPQQQQQQQQRRQVAAVAPAQAAAAPAQAAAAQYPASVQVRAAIKAQQLLGSTDAQMPILKSGDDAAVYMNVNAAAKAPVAQVMARATATDVIKATAL